MKTQMLVGAKYEHNGRIDIKLYLFDCMGLHYLSSGTPQAFLRKSVVEEFEVLDMDVFNPVKTQNRG